MAHHAGMHLARLRNARGLSQRDLADMIGMDAATVQRAETMHPSAKLATYKLCAAALKVPLEAIFCAGALSDEEELALALYRRIPEGRRSSLLELFRLAETPRPPEA